MSKKDIAIKVSGVSKIFKLPHEKHTSVKSAALNLFRKRSYEQQQVLDDMSFEVKKGEFFGIVGRNGSGKSTLLKLLAGIYVPDKGTIAINGSLTPFIELGVGFNQELTGRENVFLNGALLGFNRKEIETMYDDIVTFAELEKFMDQKLKNYSSGMQVRLAFSIAIRANTDILLIDEVLAVGDASFQQKCFDIFYDLKKNGTTIILVTHDMQSVLRFCDRAMLVHDSKLVNIGKPADIADRYLELNYDSHEDGLEHNKIEDKNGPHIKSVTLCDNHGKVSHAFGSKDDLNVTLEFDNPRMEECHFGIQIFNDADIYCFGTNTKIAGSQPIRSKKGRVNLRISLSLASGNYFVTSAIMNENASTVFTYRPKIAEFRIKKVTQVEGIAILKHEWDYVDV